MRWLGVIIVALLLVVVPTASSPPQDGGAAAPGDAEATAEELEEFVPTEEITADSPVSFPVDI
jgi:hypothetical protein